MLKAYKYRLLPTDSQKATLTSWFGACRFTYNLGLETKIAAWTSLKKNVSGFDLMKQLTELKRTECPWLKDCPGQSLESALTILDNAYTAYFKGNGFPRFKKRSTGQSIQFRRGSVVNDGRIRLTKIGWVDFIQHRPFEGEIRTATVSKTPAGNYFVSILVKDEKELPAKLPVAEQTTVGVDMGLKTFAVLYDGQQFQNPRLLQGSLKRLRIEQRRLSRRFKKGVKISAQSKGWHDQRLVVARLYEKIANQRKDFLHKFSDAITKQYDMICVEDLNIAGMIRNRKLAKAISDAGWSEGLRMVKYKAEWRGKNYVEIGRFAPSSKLHEKCGYINKDLTLSQRVWECPNCKGIVDRDQNAANNIKNFGLKAQASTANVAGYSERIGCKQLSHSAQYRNPDENLDSTTFNQ